MVYVQWFESFGWQDYHWADGLRGAKKTYRNVRVIERHMDPKDPRFFSSKIKILKVYKDGRRIR